MSAKPKVTRNCPGSYNVAANGRTVVVNGYSRRDGATFDGWIAQAEWDRFYYTDPLPTKRDAVANAVEMLKNPVV